MPEEPTDSSDEHLISLFAALCKELVSRGIHNEAAAAAVELDDNAAEEIELALEDAADPKEEEDA